MTLLHVKQDETWSVGRDDNELRGLVQTICGKISVIMMFGGEGFESLTLSLAFTL